VKHLDAHQIDEPFLLRILAPRPLAWVTTRDKLGAPNIAPFSAVMLIDSDPATLMLVVKRLSDGQRKSTARNILETGAFAINLPSPSELPALMRSASPGVRSADRFRSADVTLSPFEKIHVDRVADANCVLECQLVRHDLFADKADLFLGAILYAHAKHDGSDGPGAFIGALGYEWFVTSEGNVFVPQPYLASES